MSSCSIDSALNLVKETPALALGAVETPLGALCLFFLFFTSIYGVQQLTSAESILDLMKKSALQLFSFLSPFLQRARVEGDKAIKKDWTWLSVYTLAAALSAGLLIAFSTDEITWLTAAVAILFGMGAISLIGRYYSSVVANALVGGTVLGVSVFVIYFMIAKSSAYTTGYIVPDLFFVCLIVYILLSFIALSEVAGKGALKIIDKKLQDRLQKLQDAQLILKTQTQTKEI